MSGQVTPRELRAGDVLVQYRGQPWVFLARLITGLPYPHSQVVSRVELSPIFKEPTVWILENSADGLHEKEAYDLGSFLAVRPTCDEATTAAALDWIRRHIGEGYGFGHLGEIVVGYRLGLRARPGMDDDMSQDGRAKVCSETIAMGFYRAGQLTGSRFDAVPGVADRDTMPADFLASPAMLVLGPVVPAC